MARTARFMRAELQSRLDGAIAAGAGAVFVVALLAVGREGLETALFLWANAQTTQTTAGPLLGALLGLGTSFVIAWAFFRGAVKLNLRVFFAWTGLILIVIAAGVLAYGVHDLQEAGILPGIDNLAFDVSATIPPTSIVGTLLKGVFNFSPAMTWLEVIVWVAYIVPVTILFVRHVWFSAPPPPARVARRIAVTARARCRPPPDAPPGRVTARPIQPSRSRRTR